MRLGGGGSGGPGSGLPDPGPGFSWSVAPAGAAGDLTPLTVLRIPFLEETGLVRAGFSSRLGGESREPWASLNLGFFVGDDLPAVAANRRRLFNGAGLDAGRAVGALQVHGSHVTRIGTAEAGRGALDPNSLVPDTDGLITDAPGLTLTIGCADCLALYFVDPVHRAVGLSHAGWRGTASDIAARTLDAMGESFGTVPSEVRAAVSPGIGGCCYEVDDAVWRAFQPEETPLLAGAFRPAPTREGQPHWMLDLGRANRVRLEEAGVPSANILVSPLCTACHPGVFFSHRRDQGRTGRMLAFLSILENGCGMGGLRP